MAESNLNLSREAKQVFEAAYSFTRFLGQNQLTAEYLLLSLLKAPQSEVAFALTELGYKPRRLGNKLQKEIRIVKSGNFPPETITKSSEIETIEILALKEAKNRNSEFISTLHLLHAILELHNLQANKWLHYHGITLDKLQHLPIPTRKQESIQFQNWDYFSGPVKTILGNAQMIATRYKQNTITTSHILLGMLQTPESNAFKQLSSLTDNLEALTLNISREISFHKESSHSGSRLILGDDLKKMLESAAKDVRFGYDLECIDSRLLLLGIIEQEKTPAAQLLAKSYIGFEQLRDQPKFVREYPSSFSTQPPKKLTVFSNLRRWFKREK